MLFDKFKAFTKNFWDNYFKYLTKLQADGYLYATGGTIIYPNMLLVTDCKGYYIAELMGASRKYNGLTLKIHKESSIDRYLSQFEYNGTAAEPCLHLDSHKVSFDGICISNIEKDNPDISKRFPFLDYYQTGIRRTNGNGSLFTFGDNFISCALHNSVLVNKGEFCARAKFISGLYIFSSRISKKNLIEELEHYTKDSPKGIYISDNDVTERKIISGQFQNTFLLQGVRETTIGEFINRHPEIIKKAFDTDHFLYEPSLNWLEHDGTCEDTSINPDLLVRRKDGKYDIYDLKTALLNNKKLTTADRKRRQFIHTVRDGIAQLGNYQEYFQYPKNAQHALEKYGVVVNNPNLVLIVGNMENYDAAEISQAGRLLPNLQIIDYDTLCHLFMGTFENPNIELNS